MNTRTSKWDFQEKKAPSTSGSTIISRAGLVAQGSRKIHVVPSSETYASVAKLTCIPSLPAFFAQYYLKPHQMDVFITFLNRVKEDIYVEVAKGVERISRQTTGCKQTAVRKLVKDLYGLKQALRQWNY